MVKIAAIAGSLREKSFNAAIVRAAVRLAPAGSTIELCTMRGIPVYDGDLEAAGIPPAVSDLKDRVAQSDGLLVASPEYNNSLPGPLKNAIDWMSRPTKDIPRVFGGMPVALLGATPGPGGTRLAQTAWLPVWRTLGMAPWFGKALYIDGVDKLLDQAGELSDAAMTERLRVFVAGFVEFVARNPRRR